MPGCCGGKKSNVGEVVLKVEGMTCNHCKSAVEKAVKGVDGSRACHVNLDDKTVLVTFDKDVARVDMFTRAIEEAGYRVRM